MPRGYKNDGTKLGFQKGSKVNKGRVLTREHKEKNCG